MQRNFTKLPFIKYNSWWQVFVAVFNVTKFKELRILVVFEQLEVRGGNKKTHRSAAETIITFLNCSRKNDGEYCRSVFATHKD